MPCKASWKALRRNWSKWRIKALMVDRRCVLAIWLNKLVLTMCSFQAYQPHLSDARSIPVCSCIKPSSGRTRAWSITLCMSFEFPSSTSNHPAFGQEPSTHNSQNPANVFSQSHQGTDGAASSSHVSCLMHKYLSSTYVIPKESSTC